MCIRDQRSRFIKAATTWYEGCPPPQEAEAVGLRDAILWLGQLKLSNVQLELDCKLVLIAYMIRITTRQNLVVSLMTAGHYYKNLQTLR
ncbi:hypothetical protein MTR_2g014845 [Medicago truncatula]|uniref:RNase H type-1 domain-containing protein n=1 Tax=Medicago truncatula TaxID=3880 RepID=A0A072V5D0_MEDTR|nr:hypothetical protein MTR_2g014845 [Medicago truncatula]